MKICNVCKASKDKTEFHGNSAKCKPCQVSYVMSIDIGPTRQCKTCESVKPVEEFRKNNRSRGGRAHKCNRCESVSKFKRQYGIENIYEFILDKTCEICGTPIAEGKFKFAIDHDHSCCPGTTSCGRCVRGLLCAHCNNGLGYFKDSVESLRAAIKYLERNDR